MFKPTVDGMFKPVSQYFLTFSRMFSKHFPYFFVPDDPRHFCRFFRFSFPIIFLLFLIYFPLASVPIFHWPAALFSTGPPNRLNSENRLDAKDTKDAKVAVASSPSLAEIDDSFRKHCPISDASLNSLRQSLLLHISKENGKLVQQIIDDSCYAGPLQGLYIKNGNKNGPRAFPGGSQKNCKNWSQGFPKGAPYKC